MGILSWLFGKSTRPSRQHGNWEGDDNEDVVVPSQNHGRGKYSSQNGNDYERFRPANDIENRGKYKIEQTFEVAGAFAFKTQINAICDWLASAPPQLKVMVLAEREPTNQYDPNAIRLLLQANGLAVTPFGYLPKEIARQYKDQLPVVELETIYQRREVMVRTLVKRDKAIK